MKRVSLVPLALLAAPVVSSNSVTAAEQPKRPNVILIYADDMGIGDISILNRESKINTPNLDQLARSGVRFTDAHTVSSVSTPSRYGIMTGEYSWRSSLKADVIYGHAGPIIPANKPTIATMLKRSGYKTACVGKWHLGLNWATTDGKPAHKSCLNIDYSKPLTNTPTSRGFDYFYGIAASLDIPPYAIIENDRVETIPDARYPKTTFTRRDNDVAENPFLRAGDYVSSVTPEMYLPRFTDKVKSLVSDYSKQDDPFFIYFALNAPHAPIVPSEKFRGKSGIGLYGDFMLEVDDVVGQVVEQLKRDGLYDNTIIILSSDNGAEFFAYYRLSECGHNSSGEYRGIKRDLWEGGHRVPLFMSWSGHFKSGQKVDKTVCISDIYATLADITDTQMAKNEAQDSYSLLPLLTRKGKYERDYTVHHSARGRFAIRKGDWVLIEGGSGDDNGRAGAPEYYAELGYEKITESPKGELYNIRKDLSQRNSLYAQNPAKVAELTAILDRITDGWGTRRDKYMKK